MTEIPKTPRTPKTPTRRARRDAPRVPSPSALAAATPKDRKVSTPGRKLDRHTSEPRPATPARKLDRHTSEARQASEARHAVRMQTSREIAEVIALLRAVSDMKVVEVPLGGLELTEKKLAELVKLKVPVVFRGLAADWKCVNDWAKPGYLKRAASEEATTCPHRKYRQFHAQSAESGRLHLTDGKAKGKPVSIEEFLQNTVTTANTDGLYLLGIHAVHGSLSYCPVQTHLDDKEVVPPLSKDLPGKVNFLEWYAKLLGVGYDHQQFFLAKGYAFTDLHYDSYDNFYVAASGTRRWTLASPNASRWLVDAAGGKLKSGSALVPHQNSFAGSPAEMYPFAYIDLLPGDVLFVPACWWHLVESKAGSDGFSSAFNFFFSKPPDEVFGEFQAKLAETDSVVNALQSECRTRIAQTCRESGVDHSLDITLTKAPRGFRQGLWDQLCALAAVHDLQEELKLLHTKWESNSVQVWADDTKADVGEPVDKAPTKTVKTRNAKMVETKEPNTPKAKPVRAKKASN